MVWEYFFYFYILQDLIEKKKTEKYEFLKNGQYNIISL